MPVTTSVVICAYTEQRWDQLLAAVASVQAQLTPVNEIVVVVDHHDVLLRRLQGALPDVRIIASEGARGLSAARNTGVEQTRGDIVAFLDDDATAAPEWISRLLDAYSDADVLGVGGSARPQWESGPPAWWPEEFDWVVGCSYRGQPTRTATVRNLMGCNMSLRRTVLDTVGGFDSGLGRTADRPLGCEETELCIRAIAAFPTGRFVLEPRAVVRHSVPRQRATWAYFQARCRAEGVSKAWVAERVGRSAALATERGYVSRTLPSGVVRNLGKMARGEPAAGGRAAAIIAGLALTSSTYLAARLRRPRVPPETLTAAPVLPVVVDLQETPVALDLPGDRAEPYRTAICLVTDGGRLVGRVPVVLTDDRISADQVTEQLGAAVGSSDAPGPTEPTGPGDISVVVATRDRPELLQECLGSIFAGSWAPSRVIVVDNAPSTEETARLVERLAAVEPRLRYVREERPGLARAHNAALPYLASSYVAFTDDDVVVERRWLEHLVAAFALGDDVACVTGMIAPRELDTLPQQWVEGNATYDKGLRRRTFDNRAHRPRDPLFPYTSGSFGSGANMAFRADYLRRHGGFDDALGTGTYALGGDDLAAFYDVIADGRTLVYEPAAIVLHRHHRHYAGLRRQTYGYGAGLGAHLTRCFLRDPRMALVLLRHAAAAARRAGEIVTPPPVTGIPGYPADLSRQQLRGLASGPLRYLVSRHRLRREAA